MAKLKNINGHFVESAFVKWKSQFQTFQFNAR